MEITDIHVKNYLADQHFFDNCDGLFHSKKLPFLSIVQSLEGFYSIQIDDGPVMQTTEMGAFIAPANKLQNITHNANSKTGNVKNQWIFLDILINGRYLIDEIFEFPLILPEKYQAEVNNIISSVIEGKSICKNLSNIYILLEILLDIGTEKLPCDDQSFQIKYYIDKNYANKINYNEMAQYFNLSLSTLFRKFKKSTGTSPVKYIEILRLEHACALLESTTLSVNEISNSIGISDIFYFSKLFKRKYNVSPTAYRKNMYPHTQDKSLYFQHEIEEK